MDFWNNLLQLPERCLLNRKITKAFFKRNFDLTLTERGLLDKQIENINWLATISPDNTNIPAFISEEVMYEEVQVIIATVHATGLLTDHVKIAELIHKHIPYAILLCVSSPEHSVWSTCNKRIKQNDKNKRIIEKRFFTEIIPTQNTGLAQNAFLQSLGFAGLSKIDLQQLYNSYTERIFALQAAALNGTFAIRTQSRTAADMMLLERLEVLEKEISVLTNTARKETQLNMQVSFNLQIQTMRQEAAQLKTQITREN